MLFDDKRWKMPEIPAIEPEQEPWRKLLKDAIKIVQKRGWAVCTLEHGRGGPVCALGALQLAQRGYTDDYKPDKTWKKIPKYTGMDRRKAMYAIGRIIPQQHSSWSDRPIRRGTQDHIWHWNDSDCGNGSNLINKLREASES